MGKSEDFKLPILEIIAEAFARTNSNLKLLIYPLSVISLFILAYEFVVPNYFDEYNKFGLAIGMCIHVVLYALFAITCHRIVILGFDAVPKFGLFKLSSREIKYLAYIGISYLFFFVTYLGFEWFFGHLFQLGADISIVLSLLYFAVMVICLYSVGRLILVLPSVAVDNPISPKTSFKLTEGNGWRIFFVVIIVPLLSGILVGLLPDGLIVLEVLGSIFWLYLYVIEVSALSISYRYLIEDID